MFDMRPFLSPASQLASTGEYCMTETFKAACPENQVILIQRALYGRMKLGRCVRLGLNYLGCAADVQRLVDRRCSGRSYCEFYIPDAELEALGECLSELKSYLEVTYTCIDGRYSSYLHVLFFTCRTCTCIYTQRDKKS